MNGPVDGTEGTLSLSSFLANGMAQHLSGRPEIKIRQNQNRHEPLEY